MFMLLILMLSGDMNDKRVARGWAFVPDRAARTSGWMDGTSASRLSGRNRYSVLGVVPKLPGATCALGA